MSGKNQDETRRAGVIGWPVSHSLSPLIHSTWAAREGANALYEAIAVEPDDRSFRRRIDELRAAGLAGVNVTIPHKERALRYAATASDEARAIGAANMLTFGDEGAHADNSDARGFEAALRVELGQSSGRTMALVLGAGGAARAILWSLRHRLHFPEIIIANRTRARAEGIAEIGLAGVKDWEARNDAIRAADIVVNATSLGMMGEPPLDVDFSALKPGAIVCDIVYSPLKTPLLRAARARGLATIDGLEMLMRQAAPGYLAWLGTKAEIDADLRLRLEAALKARGE